MKNIIFMGKTGCGKTTLCQKLDKLELIYNKTQSIQLYTDSIDTPGEYIENRGFYNALIVAASDAKIIGVVYDATQERNYIAPGFASRFPKDVIGIITKINLATEQQIDYACEMLNMIGVNKIFKVDTIDYVGIDELFKYLRND